jgi:hypothetical protein
MYLTRMVRSRSHRLSKPKREPLKGSLARCTLVATLVFIEILCFEKTNSVATDNHVMNLKLYAYHKFKTYDQFDCYNYIIYRESRWDYKARNGSHYGLGQMRNTMVLKLTPRGQIDLHYKYIAHRYGIVNGEPNACLAAEHLDKKGWH